MAVLTRVKNGHTDSFGCAGKTVSWYASDTEELYKKNLKNNPEILAESGWNPDPGTISYSINSYGFRDEEFELEPDNESFIALGCSFTSGLGIPLEHTWPKQLENILGIKSRNLGAPGTGIETFFRLAQAWVPIIRPKYVFCLENPGNRREFRDIRNNDWMTHTVWKDNKTLDFLLDDEEYDMAKARAVFGIKALCNEFDAKFIYLSQAELFNMDNKTAKTLFDGRKVLVAGEKMDRGDYRGKRDTARDLLHFGQNYMKNVAEKMHSLHTNSNRNINEILLND